MQVVASGSRSVGRAAQATCMACCRGARLRSRRHGPESQRLASHSRERAQDIQCVYSAETHCLHSHCLGAMSSAPLPAPLRHPSNGSTSSRSFTATLPLSMAKGFGQPLPSTHPHLLKPGELTEGISSAEYESRRRRLMEGLPEQSIVILAGGRLQYSSQSILWVKSLNVYLNRS